MDLDILLYINTFQEIQETKQSLFKWIYDMSFWLHFLNLIRRILTKFHILCHKNISRNQKSPYILERNSWWAWSIKHQNAKHLLFVTATLPTEIEDKSAKKKKKNFLFPFELIWEEYCYNTKVIQLFLISGCFSPFLPFMYFNLR